MESINYLEKRFSKNPDMVFRQIGGECLLVPVGQKVVDLNHIYMLNPVAGRIWELLDGQNTVQDIRDRLSTEFTANPQEVERDLQEFLPQLAEIGGIRET